MPASWARPPNPSSNRPRGGTPPEASSDNSYIPLRPSIDANRIISKGSRSSVGYSIDKYGHSKTVPSASPPKRDDAQSVTTSLQAETGSLKAETGLFHSQYED